MSVSNTAREMRANGKSVPEIAARCNISLGYAYKLVSDVTRHVAQAADIVTRMVPRNGGCSTTSGMVPVSMPRIVALHGVAA